MCGGGRTPDNSGTRNPDDSGNRKKSLAAGTADDPGMNGTLAKSLAGDPGGRSLDSTRV